MDSFNKTKIVDETIRKKKIFFCIVEKKSCTGRSRPSPTVRGKPPTNRNGVIEPRHQVAKEWGRVSTFCWLFFFTCRLFLVFFLIRRAICRGRLVDASVVGAAHATGTARPKWEGWSRAENNEEEEKKPTRRNRGHSGPALGARNSALGYKKRVCVWHGSALLAGPGWPDDPVWRLFFVSSRGGFRECVSGPGRFHGRCWGRCTYHDPPLNRRHELESDPAERTDVLVDRGRWRRRRGQRRRRGARPQRPGPDRQGQAASDPNQSIPSQKQNRSQKEKEEEEQPVRHVHDHDVDVDVVRLEHHGGHRHLCEIGERHRSLSPAPRPVGRRAHRHELRR